MMTCPRERGGDKNARDAGLGLPELLVTMMLMALIAILVGTLVTAVSRALTSDRIANNNTTSASIAMNEMNRVLRAGTGLDADQPAGSPVFFQASATSVTVSAFVDTTAAAPQPVKVRFELTVATGELSETRWTAKPDKSSWTFATAPSSTRVIARGVTKPTAAKPLFTDRKSVV